MSDFFSSIFQLTAREHKYLTDSEFVSPVYQNIPLINFKGQQVYRFVLPKLQENILEIRRDSRFRPVPAHIHSNITFQYVYSGKCTYEIDHKQITLTKGGLCLLDKNTIRSKKRLEADDIVLTISLSNDFFSKDFLLSLGESSILTRFLIGALSQNDQHDSYLIFKKDNKQIDYTIERLVNTYFSKQYFRKELIETYLKLIFIYLLQDYRIDKKQQIIHFSTNYSVEILDILSYIENSYVHGSLQELAEQMGYHPKYLSYLIKKNLSTTFKELQTNQRIENVKYLLVNSTVAISEIAEESGFSNLTNFYKKFAQYVGSSPNEYRKNGQLAFNI